MDGFILINKEIGETSNNVVQKVKKALKAKKVGHLGTLDPIAEGLLILAINKATKFSSYFLESDKSYEVKVELGKSTDTDDSSGKVIFESNFNLFLFILFVTMNNSIINGFSNRHKHVTIDRFLNFNFLACVFYKTFDYSYIFFYRGYFNYHFCYRINKLKIILRCI